MTEWKAVPKKGLVHLHTLDIGNKFEVNGLTAMLVNKGINCDVVILEKSDCEWHRNYESYYSGKQTWASKTEVKPL